MNMRIVVSIILTVLGLLSACGGRETLLSLRSGGELIGVEARSDGWLSYDGYVFVRDAANGELLQDALLVQGKDRPFDIFETIVAITLVDGQVIVLTVPQSSTPNVELRTPGGVVVRTAPSTSPLVSPR